MLGFQVTEQSIQDLINQIRTEDTNKKLKIKKSKQLSTIFIGMIYFNNKNNNVKKSVPIYFSSDYSFEESLCGHMFPTAVVIKPTGKKETFIAINQIMIEWYLSTDESYGWRHYLARAILCHELGHIIAGHFKQKLPLELSGIDNIQLEKETDPFPILTRALLSGAIFTRELEADLWAIRISNDPSSVIHLHSYYATFSDTLGIRLEHANRVAELNKRMDSPEWNEFIKDDNFELEIIFSRDQDLNVMENISSK